MARRKIEQLRDDVINAARTFVTARTRFYTASDENVDDLIDASAALPPLGDALMLAVDALDAYLVPIVDTPGDYVEGSPETSRNSAVAFKPLSGKVRRGIVNEIYSVHGYASIGLTCAELMARLRENHQTVSGACTFLCDAGWIQDSGMRRLAPSKRPQMVWRLTPAGLAKMQETS